MPTAPTTVSLTFDDTFVDNETAVELLDVRGMRATFYVNSSRIDRPGFFSRDRLLAMQAAGHEIGGHTVHHVNLKWIDDGEARRQICDDRVALLELGFAATTFAYPFSGNDPATRGYVAECGYNAARIVGGLGPTETCPTCPLTSPTRPADLYRIPTNDSVDETTTLAMLKGYVEQAEQNGGGWVPIVFHHVCDGCNPLAITPAMLEEFLDWLAARAQHGTTVATVRDVVGGGVRPAVAGPAPEHARDPLNLLSNASLERDIDRNAVPDCWQRGGSGDNVATYAPTFAAAHGAVAQRIEITSWTSGVRRLVSAQDLGGCARVIDPLQQYVVRARYRASVPTRFSVFVRRVDGWSAFAQSAPLPPSLGWTSASYAIPPLAPDVNGLSVGLTIGEAGALTMDAFSLALEGVKLDENDHVEPGRNSESLLLLQ